MRALVDRRLALVGLFAWLALPLCAAAAPVEPGSALPTLTLTDQHDKPWTVAPSTKQLLFAADKAGSDFANAVLAAQGPGFLNQGGVVYLADISAMPALVTRMFALPKLRELAFPIGLARDAALTAELPRQSGHVTVLDLNQGVITKIRFAADAKALRQALGIAAD